MSHGISRSKHPCIEQHGLVEGYVYDICMFKAWSYFNSFLLWDIGKQHSPRSDAAEAASHLGLFCLLKGISSKNGIKIKNHS